MHKFTKKRIAIGAIGLLVVVGAAVAYFTTTGSGTGNAKVGESEALHITATVTGELYPGTESEVKFAVANPSPGKQFVKKVELEKVEAFSDSGHTVEMPPCDAHQATWFTMTAVTENQEVAAHAEGEELNHPGHLKFVNVGEEQNQCEKAYLVAHFTSE